MGFVEKDRDALTGNSLLLGDLLLTWDDGNPLLLETEAQEETDVKHPKQEDPSKAESQPKR